MLQLRHFLAQHLCYPRRNRRYFVPQMILALVSPIVLGLDRIETSSFLRSNGAFQYLAGLPSFPDPQTLRRFLLQAPPRFWEQLHGVNDRLLQHFIHRSDHRSRLIFDLDSAVVARLTPAFGVCCRACAMNPSTALGRGPTSSLVPTVG